MRLFPPRNRNPTVIGLDGPPGEYQWIRQLPTREIGRPLAAIPINTGQEFRASLSRPTTSLAGGNLIGVCLWLRTVARSEEIETKIRQRDPFLADLGGRRHAADGEAEPQPNKVILGDAA